MKRDTFTKALSATAKIACCASLLNVSCKPKTDVASPTDTANSNQNIDTANSETGEPLSDFEECQPIIQAEFDNNSFPDPATVPQEVKDCCALTAAYYDELALEAGDSGWEVLQNWTERDQCCSALEWSDGSMACTPWGPPTPPSAHKMKRRIIVKQIINPTPVFA